MSKKTESRTEETALQHQAESDYLTGLANRWGLNKYYSSLPEDARVHAMFIDIDNFKSVNDVYGHSVGDELLVSISELIVSHTHGFTSRIGGDEYVVLMDTTFTKQQLGEIAQGMLDDMPHMAFRKDILSLVSLSIGIILDQEASQPLDDILYKCDSAMYEAKYNGKNRYVFYKAYDRIVRRNRNIELEMEHALETGQFVPYFQPKVNMVTTELCGAEALARWKHPRDGIREPMMFVPLFEKNGFISRLDMNIFEQVCALKATWKGEKYEHIPVSVNMSRLHLYNIEFPNELEAICRKYDVPTCELELEITESVFIKDTSKLINMVSLLQEHGFQVSIDDFGSGFSALNLLKDIPVNTIKLDRGFLHESANTARGKKVIRNIIAMCRDLKLDVVTEGVETKEQIDFIVSCGCQVAQGFYYSKPIDHDAFIEFASEYLSNPLDHFEFRLNGSLASEDGSMKAVEHGEGMEFTRGIFTNSKAIRFPGGETGNNVLYLPTTAIVNDSYTISMWINPEKNYPWASAMYVKFESGFLSILPLAWDSYSDFRIRDSKEVDGWYDINACQLSENNWAHFVVSYNAKNETATAFINGEVIGRRENVPTNRFVKWIIVGGDVFQPSFKGKICEIQIFNEAKDYKFVSELHQAYVSNKKFVGFTIDVEPGPFKI